MVHRGPFPISPKAEGLHKEPTRVFMESGEEDLDSSDRTTAARIKRSATLRVSSSLAIAWGVILTVLAVTGVFGGLAMGFALMYQVERTIEVSESAEHMRNLNQSCQSELGLTKGELNRLDRLLQYARGGR